MAWLEELNARVPNGVGVTPDKCHAGQAGAAAGGSAVLGDGAARDPRQLHVELSALDAPPAGANISGFPREPLDVYQRLVNANYILNVHRRALMDDFSCFAA